ncbi:MBOAT family O-acyltransferase [Desulfogranum mediterraneum]|uniref:MBOAT family O-acyltransferase n=1 Tax=Desulfogranum mediterraneum TaxID=160661 RepID=UPI0004087E89|nr:MBOAT family protein [Desulfogranum mediterraneum]
MYSWFWSAQIVEQGAESACLFNSNGCPILSVVFSSTTFLFLFLPLVISSYYLAGATRWRNLVLLGASLFFYAWGEGVYLGLMLLSIGFNYWGGLALGGTLPGPRRRLLLAGTVGFNLLLLGGFKYANFAVDSLNQLLSLVALAPPGLQPSQLSVIHLPAIQLQPIHLPIGISFFTFQAISYLVDVSRGQARAQRSLLDCGLYIALFPQLIAGPIVRYHDIARQLRHRSHTSIRFAGGALLFLTGLAKKMLLANPMAGVADQVFGLPTTELTPLLAWSGSFAYTLQIYFDFSGYSDMAIGLGRLFGFELLINFNYPYTARSFREFWQRWHISLSRWFRDYLYIPLGGNRRGPGRTGLNLLLVFLLCGLWHGASVNFIIWGLLHGCFLVTERGRLGRLIAGWWRPCQHLYLLAGVLLSWVFFRGNDLSHSLGFLQAMAGFGSGVPWLHPLGLFWNKATILAALVGIVAATPLAGKVHQGVLRSHGESRNGRALLCLAQACWGFFLLTGCAMELAAGTHNPFIYFRF